MAADPLLHAAVINNARWCNAVCRSHGYPGQFTGRLWTSVRHALPFYPNAITLSPDATVAEVTAGPEPVSAFRDQGTCSNPGLPTIRSGLVPSGP